MPHEEYIFINVDHLQSGDSANTIMNALRDMIWNVANGAEVEVEGPFKVGYPPQYNAIRITYVSPEPDPEDYEDDEDDEDNECSQ